MPRLKANCSRMVRNEVPSHECIYLEAYELPKKGKLSEYIGMSGGLPAKIVLYYLKKMLEIIKAVRALNGAECNYLRLPNLFLTERAELKLLSLYDNSSKKDDIFACGMLLFAMRYCKYPTYETF